MAVDGLGHRLRDAVDPHQNAARHEQAAGDADHHQPDEGGGQRALEDGFDALSKINDFRPDMVFCDILMPKLDGYQTCAIVKRNDAFASTPVVMLSSKDGVFDKARGRMVGCEDYLTKPFTKDQLLETVGRFVAVR